jgi:tyrosyl-tRNA synthetase
VGRSALTSPFRFTSSGSTPTTETSPLLKFFTFFDEAAIEALAVVAAREPEKREAQRALATHVTDLVHGEEQRRRAEQASALLFRGDLRQASKEDILMVFDDVPSTSIDRTEFADEGIAVTRLITASGLEQSTARPFGS